MRRAGIVSVRRVPAAVTPSICRVPSGSGQFGTFAGRRAGRSPGGGGGGGFGGAGPRPRSSRMRRAVWVFGSRTSVTPATGSEIVTIPPQRQERLLDDVVGRGQSAHVRGVAVNRALVPLVEAGEGILVAPADPFEQPDVVHLNHILRRGKKKVPEKKTAAPREEGAAVPSSKVRALRSQFDPPAPPAFRIPSVTMPTFSTPAPFAASMTSMMSL